MKTEYCLINPDNQIVLRRDHDPEGDMWHIDRGWSLRPASECTGLPDAPPPQPKAVPVTPRQLRLWLHSQGRLSAVESAIDGMPEAHRTVARIEWDYATEYRPDNPMVAALGAALGLTSDQIAGAFAAASQL